MLSALGGLENSRASGGFSSETLMVRGRKIEAEPLGLSVHVAPGSSISARPRAVAHNFVSVSLTNARRLDASLSLSWRQLYCAVCALLTHSVLPSLAARWPRARPSRASTSRQLAPKVEARRLALNENKDRLIDVATANATIDEIASTMSDALLRGSTRGWSQW